MTTVDTGASGHRVSLDHLETRYRHLDREVGSLREDVASHTATLNQMNVTLQDIAKTVNAPKRTEWQAIIAAATLVFTLAAAYSTLNTRPIETNLARVAERQLQSMDLIATERVANARIIGAIEARILAQESENENDAAIQMRILEKLYSVGQSVGRNESRHKTVITED